MAAARPPPCARAHPTHPRAACSQIPRRGEPLGGPATHGAVARAARARARQRSRGPAQHGVADTPRELASDLNRAPASESDRPTTVDHATTPDAGARTPHPRSRSSRSPRRGPSDRHRAHMQLPTWRHGPREQDLGPWKPLLAIHTFQNLVSLLQHVYIMSKSEASAISVEPSNRGPLGLWLGPRPSLSRGQRRRPALPLAQHPS